MLIMKIIASLVATVLVVGGIVNFNRWTVGKYGHRFFSWIPLIVGAASVWVVMGGISWMRADASGNGLVLTIIGSAVSLGLILFNVARTSLLVGVVGSTLQIASYIMLGFLGAIFAVPALFVAIAAAFGRAEPTLRQVHHHTDHDPASAL